MARTAFISKGILPFQMRRWNPSFLSPAEPQPRFVSPTNIEPSCPHVIRKTPDWKLFLKSKDAPWYSPFTFSRKIRDILLCPWSPTKICPSNGPNLPPVLSTINSELEMPKIPCGNHTAGTRTSGKSFFNS